MADYGRIAQILAEVGVEPTDIGRVASLFLEAGAVDSATVGRLAHIYAEVGTHEAVVTSGRLQSVLVNVVAETSSKIRVNGMWAEVFLVPGAGPTGGPKYTIQGTLLASHPDLQGGPVQGRFRR